MLSESQWRVAATVLPFLADPTAEVTRTFVSQATLIRLPPAATVFEEGDVCSTFAILAQGQVRVFKIGETGREITLYRFARGESCILTASCILSERQFPAIATVETQAEAFVVAHTTFQQWVDTFPPWRDYVFQLLSRRLATVMAIIDEVAFRRMDVRIAAFLIHQSARDGATLALTHQQIAAELGSSREVVSRILADFAANGSVHVTRGSIAILDLPSLAQRAAGR
ncbi:MAG: Crp/Fnr family transcriptional regulator [Candidatus Viridilinea halotolerans]|uniref:Crp/Fnr family transcriptional regulator n=1 Tax=Candidatus Viridilinea halotolerans TaxID=2491704 RepID=A0A426TW86_9CHLR|nr:MAG: Crp/Fnr family transcriptional regulator [Candidatus Viridilinea halotolerans]